MSRIPTVELVSRLLEEEYHKENVNMSQYARKVRVNRQSVINLIGRRTTYIKSDYMDTILAVFNLSLAELEENYGTNFKSLKNEK